MTNGFKALWDTLWNTAAVNPYPHKTLPTLYIQHMHWSKKLAIIWVLLIVSVGGEMGDRNLFDEILFINKDCTQSPVPLNTAGKDNGRPFSCSILSLSF